MASEKELCQRFPHRQRNFEYSGLFSGSLLEIIERLREALSRAHDHGAVTVTSIDRALKHSEAGDSRERGNMQVKFLGVRAAQY